MLNVFEAILNFLQMVGNYITNVLEGLLSLIVMIPRAFGLLQYVQAYMPAQLWVFIAGGLAICIVFQIIGR